MTRRAERRRATDNVDLSGAEHAWWAGNGPGRRAPGPPSGIPDRRRETVPAGPPHEPASAPLAASAATPPQPSASVRSGSWLLDDRAPDADPWNRSTAPTIAEAYRVLGIDWEASWAEVTTEYRTLAACWHPDRLANADPAVQAEAQRRMSEFNRAYNDLRRVLRPTSRRDLFAD